MFNVIDQYNSFVENNFIKKNEDQIEFLKQANNVWSSFSKTKLFFKWLQIKGLKKKQIFRPISIGRV